jgi:hypothetical protein
MFRLLTVLVTIGVAIYKTLYGNDKTKETHPPQTTQQPLGVSIPVVIIRKQQVAKPEVLWGDPLTDEEWSMIQNSDRTYLN